MPATRWCCGLTRRHATSNCGTVWWRQNINLYLPLGKQVDAQVELDLSDLPNLATPRLAVTACHTSQSPGAAPSRHPWHDRRVCYGSHSRRRASSQDKVKPPHGGETGTLLRRHGAPF